MSSDIGAVAYEEWAAAAQLRRNVYLDDFVIMPNHLHGILWITEAGDQATPRSGPARGSVGAIVGQFKSRVTRRANAAGLWNPLAPLWQRGFYDRIIRSDEALQRMRRYIRTNPMRWEREGLV